MNEEKRGIFYFSLLNEIRLGKIAACLRTAWASVGEICYHVINRGNAREQVFQKQGDYQAFVELIRLACQHMAMLLHDDEKREYTYGPAQGLPNTRVGTFTQALYDEVKKKGWTVISMKNDCKTIFSFDK